MAPKSVMDSVDRDKPSASEMQAHSVKSETISQSAVADTLPLDDGNDLAPDNELFRRGRSALELLEAVRISAPDQLADLAPSAGEIDGDRLPRTIGRFRILRELGRGGYGVVFLAHDPRLNRQTALKVPRPEALVTPDLRRRFLREAEAAAALQHPHIVPIYEQGTVGPICYVASAFCDGQSLADWLERQAEHIPVDQAVRLVQALADAVQHAHSRGVLHRDLKPANVLLVPCVDDVSKSATGLTPLVIDFGLARIEGTPGETVSTAIIGTPAYMAPEQAAGRNDEVGTAVDIHALGAMLYELLTLQRPFTGRSDLEILQAVQSQEPKAPRRIRPQIPRDLEAICLKCLEKQPRQRYASAAELYTELGRYLTGQPVQARPIGSTERLRRWGRRNPALAAVSGLALAIFIGGSASVFWQWRRAERSLVELHQQEERATRNLRTAQNAVDEFLTGIATEMQDLPQTESIRNRILQRAALMNQRFLNDESVDRADARADSIQAWRRAADIAWQLGDLSQTEAAYRKLIAMCESLPSDELTAEIVVEHVSAFCRLSNVFADRRDWESSADALRDGLAVLDRAPIRIANELVPWRAEVFRSLGINAEQQGDRQQAGHCYRKAVQLIDESEPASSDSTQRLLLQLKTQSSYAIHCKQSNRSDEALQYFEKVQSALEILRHRFPDSAEYQCMAALNLYNIANLQVAMDQFEQARTFYLQAKDEFKKLAQSFPRVVMYRDFWCHSLQGAAQASRGPDHVNDRILMLKKTTFLREEILSEHPELTENIEALTKAYRNLAKDCQILEDYRDAGRYLQRAIECGPAKNATEDALNKDQLDDAWACSLLAQMEAKRQQWDQAQTWYERALETRRSAAMQLIDRNDELRDLAGLSLVLAHIGQVDQALQQIRDLPAASNTHPDADQIAAEAFFDVAELLATDKQRELQLEGLARVRAAWEYRGDEIKPFALTELKERLGDLPEYKQLVDDMLSR